MLDLPPEDLAKLAIGITAAIAALFSVLLVIALFYGRRLTKLVLQSLERVGVHLTPDQQLAAQQSVDRVLTVALQGAQERAQKYAEGLLAHGPVTEDEKRTEAKIIAKSLAPELAQAPEEHLDALLDAKAQSLRPGGLGSLAPPPGSADGSFSLPPLAGVPSLRPMVPMMPIEVPARPTPVPSKR